MKSLSSNLPKYDHIIRWCLEDILQINDYNLIIQYCSLSNCRGKFLEPNTIHIDKRFDEEETIRTLFHEIRHYYQHVTSMFDFDFDKYIVYTDRTNEDYENYASFRDIDTVTKLWLDYYHSYKTFPWELDANKFSTEIYGNYLRFGREECKKHLWQGNYENYDNCS